MGICKFLRYRYHFIPLLILCVFVAAILLARHRSPEHYKKEKIFHLSALGNWQEGLSFFSVGLVLIGSLMYVLAGEILRQRMKQIKYGAGDNVDNETGIDMDNKAGIEVGNGVGDETDTFISRTQSALSHNEAENAQPCPIKICHIVAKYPCIYWFGSSSLFLGLVITGCFQQSFNKPWHLIGLVFIGLGFLAMFLYDQSFLWCPKTSADKRKHICIARWFQILIFFVISVSGIVCVTTNFMAQDEWSAGKDAKLEELEKNGNITEKKCPGKSVNDWLNGGDYPDYYPCKSKSLWGKDDPGFNLYIISAITEVIMFIAVVIYSFTYCCLLEKQEKTWPEWAPEVWIEKGRAEKKEKAREKKEKAEEV